MAIEIKKEGLSMVANDTARLLMELEVIANTLISDEDVVKLKLRFEEVANNYNVDRKTPEDMANDFKDAIRKPIGSYDFWKLRR